MKKRIRCIISGMLATLMIIFVINYAFNIEKETKKYENPVKEAAQSNVAVSDFIHDNYVISEKNPWTDYNLHPLNYVSSNDSDFTETIGAKAAIVVDINSKNVLYGKNINEKMYPASTTKLMTALTVLQTMNLNDAVTIGDEINMIAADSSKAGFAKGQVVTVEELLNGLLISSGNDAAYVLAKATGETIFKDNIENEGKTFTASQCVGRFVLEMNKNVRDMKLENTHFTSPDGYDDNNQYTTASDLSKIAIEAYSNKTIADICKKSSQYSETLNKTWTSTNELLNKKSSYYYDCCKGLKTGSTGAAGKCLVSVGKKGDRECISVVLNAQTDAQRWTDTTKLLQFGLK